MQSLTCVNDQTYTRNYIITSVVYANGPLAKVDVARTSSAEHSHGCYYYSSVIRNNDKWKVLTCPPKALTASAERKVRAPAVETWDKRGNLGWKDKYDDCDIDEYPPMYFVEKTADGGVDARGQLVRYLLSPQSQGAGHE